MILQVIRKKLFYSIFIWRCDIKHFTIGNNLISKSFQRRIYNRTCFCSSYHRLSKWFGQKIIHFLRIAVLKCLFHFII